MKDIKAADIRCSAKVGPPQSLSLPPYVRVHFSPSNMRTSLWFDPPKKMLKAGFRPRRLGKAAGSRIYDDIR